jgi:hypothetical protein
MFRWLLVIVLCVGFGVWFGRAWEIQKAKKMDDPRRGGATQGAGNRPGGRAAGGRAGGGGRAGMPASVELSPVTLRDISTSFEATGSVESMQNVNRTFAQHPTA